MSFFRSKTAKATSGECVKILFSREKEKPSFCVVKIKPESTCQEILMKNWDEMSKPMTLKHKTEECIFGILMQDNNEYTFIMLQQNSKPYNDIKTRNLELYYMPKSAYYPIKTERTKSLELPNGNKTKAKLSVLIDGTLSLYNPSNNSFIKQRIVLTESNINFIELTPSKALNIDSNTRFNKNLVQSNNEIKEKLKDTRNIFEIIVYPNFYIFKAKSHNEYEQWLNCLNIAIHLGEDERRDQKYDHLIENYNQSIGMHSINRIEKCFDFRFFFSQDKCRRYMHAFLNNKKLFNIFENMLSYQQSALRGNCCDSWGYLLQVFSYIENFQETSDEKQNEQPFFIESDKLLMFKGLKEKIEAIMKKDLGVSSKEISSEAKDKLTKLMTCDLFEDEYNNIVENILKPYYDKQEMKDYLTKGIISVLLVDCIKVNKFVFQQKYIYLKNIIKEGLKEK